MDSKDLSSIDRVDIDGLFANFKGYSLIAILVRRNEVIEAFQKALERKNYPD